MTVRAAALAALLLGVLLGVAVPASATPGTDQAQPRRWTQPVVVNDDGRGADQEAPALAMDERGGLHAVWIDHRTAAADAGGGVHYARQPPGGSWQINQPVVRPAVSTARAQPTVAVDARGAVHVAWAEVRAGRSAIGYRRLTPGAALWSADPMAAVPGSTRQVAPALAADHGGRVHLAWVDDRQRRPRVFHRVYDPHDGWSAPQPVASAPVGDQRGPALAVAADGVLFAAWQDTRNGDSDVYAARRPPDSDAWWPAAELSVAGDTQLERRPALAADRMGGLHAVWLEDDGARGALRYAHLPPDAEFWTPSRPVYRPLRGALLKPVLAAGPRQQVLALWTASRPEGARLYSGLIGSGDDEVAPLRVDGSLVVSHAAQPSVAFDPDGVAHAVWRARDRDGQPDVVHSALALEPPHYRTVEVRGRLAYVPSVAGCLGDGYQLRDCDGAASALVRDATGRLTDFLGAHVRLTALEVSFKGCRHLRVLSVAREASPCPRQTGSVTGVVRVGGRAADGATAHLGPLVAQTGPSGRFYFDDVPAGTHPLTATLECALTAAFGPVDVRAGGRASVPPGQLVRGDVLADCAVDVRDLVRVAGRYRARPPYWPGCTDLDGDGTVSIYDLAVVAESLGATCPTPWQPQETQRRQPRSTPRDHAARRVSSTVPITLPAVSARLTLEAHTEAPLVGWAVRLRASAGHDWRDRDPRTAGLQPFSVPDDVLAVENTVEMRRGELRLTAVVPGGPRAKAGGRHVLGWLVAPDDAGRVEVLAAQLAGRGGRPVRGDVVLSQAAERSVWLPWLRAVR